MPHPLDDLLIDLAKAAPGLVALVIVVFFFLRDRGTRRTQDLEYMKHRDDLLSQISARCHETQDRSTNLYESTVKMVTDVVSKNTEVLGKVLELARRIEVKLDKLE